MINREIVVVTGDGADQACGKALQALAAGLEAALRDRNYADVAICGGSSTAALLRQMVSPAAPKTWADVKQRLRFWPGDERVVKTSSPDYNFTRINEDLLLPLGLRPGQKPWFVPSPEEPDGGVAEFNETFIEETGGELSALLAAAGGAGAGFGHFFSVFSDTLPVVEHGKGYAYVVTADKAPPRRMTLRVETCQSAATVLLIIAGGRADVLNAFCEAGPASECPCRVLKYALRGVANPKLLLCTWGNGSVPKIEF